MLLITQIKEERQSNPPHLYAHIEPKPKSVTADISGLCFLLPQTRGGDIKFIAITSLSDLLGIEVQP